MVVGQFSVGNFYFVRAFVVPSYLEQQQQQKGIAILAFPAEHTFEFLTCYCSRTSAAADACLELQLGHFE